MLYLPKLKMQPSRMVDQAKTRATTEPTLSAKVIAQEIMVSAEMCICMFIYLFIFVQMICLYIWTIHKLY